SGIPASPSSRTRSSRPTPGPPACNTTSRDDALPAGPNRTRRKCIVTACATNERTPMIIANQLFTGISMGAVLLLIALGLALTFGQMNVINMAHGELIMAGAYTVYLLQQ